MNGDSIAREVIQKAGLPINAKLTRIGGGFSDASVWRVDCTSGSFALKQYPASFDPNRLHAIHELITQARHCGLTALPEVQRFTNMQSCIEHSGAVWDLVSWQPGEALLNSAPTLARLTATGRILGQIHRIWSSTQQTTSACPAFARRLSAFHDWVGLSRQKPNSEMMKYVWSLANRHVGALHDEITRLSNCMFRIQACLCDCWHAHFLFTDDELTGLVDHAGVRMDHPLGDLARLLGSLDVTHEQRLTLLAGYQQHRLLALEDYELLRVLEASGIVCSLIFWYNRTPSLVGEERIRALIKRAEKLK